MTRLMPLTKGCQHALRAVAYLATLPAATICPRRELSCHTKTSSHFLSKVLIRLTHSGLLHSHRGRVRGYSLARPAGQISARDIIQAYDGPLGHEACILDECRICPRGRFCPVHRQRMNIQRRFDRCLAEVSARELGRVLPNRDEADRGSK